MAKVNHSEGKRMACVLLHNCYAINQLRARLHATLFGAKTVHADDRPPISSTGAKLAEREVHSSRTVLMTTRTNVRVA